MSSRARQVLDVYRVARVDDQLRYYRAARARFERAHGQLLIASAVLLGATSTVSALAGADIEGKVVWALMAAVLPAVSTALIAYGSLFAFDRLSKLFGDAVLNLMLLEEPPLDDVDEQQAEQAVTSYVEQVEKVFRDEQAQWGQLASETPSESNKTV